MPSLGKRVQTLRNGGRASIVASDSGSPAAASREIQLPKREQVRVRSSFGTLRGGETDAGNLGVSQVHLSSENAFSGFSGLVFFAPSGPRTALRTRITASGARCRLSPKHCDTKGFTLRPVGTKGLSHIGAKALYPPAPKAPYTVASNTGRESRAIRNSQLGEEAVRATRDLRGCCHGWANTGKMSSRDPVRAVGSEEKEEEVVGMKTERQNPSKAGSHRRKGVILLAGALMLTALFGFLAISTDVGFLLYLKRRVQVATDAAVMAGVQAFRRSACGDPSSAECDAKVTEYAKKGAERNGFTHGVDNITVTVNHPPASGPYSTNPLVVEVITCQLHPTFFMPLLGTYEATACARASAGLLGQAGGCIYALNRTEEKSLHVHSGATLDAGCEVVVNSANPGGLYVDSGSCLRGESIHTTSDTYVEDICLNPQYSSDPIDPDPYTSVPPTLDPLANLPDPVVPPGCDYGGSGTTLSLDSDYTLDPSTASIPGHLTLCKGLIVSGDAVVTLLPGIYYVKGETFDVTGTFTRVQGSDVMIYLTDHPGQGFEGKGLKVGSGATFDVTGRTGADDPYRGIAILVDRSLAYHKADVSFESDSTLKLSGVIYAPNQITRIHSGTIGYSTTVRLTTHWRAATDCSSIA